MCSKCNHDYELVPELETILSGRQNSANEWYNRRQPYNNYNERQYETGNMTSGKTTSQSGSNCMTPAVGLIPSFLDPKLIGCIQVTVPFERTNAIFQKSLEANPQPNWAKRITGDIPKMFPKVKVTIELWHFIPISPGRRRFLLEPLSDYLARKEGPYTVSVLGSLNAKKNFEAHFGVKLDDLMKAAGLGPSIPPDEFYSHYWHVYATFPVTIGKYLRKIEQVKLDKFEFDKFNLQTFHQPVIEIIARDVIESWLTPKKITQVRLVGHTDDRGTKAYNVQLGKKRAEAVVTTLKDIITRFAPSPYYSVDPTKLRVAYDIQSKGESSPISRTQELNRRVEVQLFYSATGSVKPLKFDDVIKRSTAVLRKFSSPNTLEQKERLLCIMTKIRNPKIDDRLLIGGQAIVDAAQGPDTFPKPDEWNRARLHFMNPILRNPRSTDEAVFKGLQWLDEMIIQAVQKINQMIKYHEGIPISEGASTPVVVRKLRDWIASQLQNPNSIYQCYKKIF